MPRFVKAAHTARPGASATSISAETSAVLETALTCISTCVKDDHERAVVASCMVAMGGICGEVAGLPQGSLVPALPVIVRAVVAVLKGEAACQVRGFGCVHD